MLTKRSHWVLVSLSILAVLALMQVLLPARTSALSGSEFQAGRIIDDAVFFDKNTMSAAEIQNFLNAKVPVCDTNGTQPYAGTTRAAYGTSRGYPPPYTCLKNYTQTTTAKAPQSGLCNGHIAGNKSSAQIIYDVAQSCGISPKVLIVLLQKEQSLVTDDWPWSIQYRSATGYGCPDTAPCDEQYYGFFNQVYEAARAFKRYALNPTSYNYRSGRNNTILWHPNSGCGNSSVFIENQATANLYIYTPYRPNSAALNNLYGTGDGCSSYGNRNFWRMFNDWFGSTYGEPFKASFRGVSPATTVVNGKEGTLWFDFQNTGSQFWKDDLSALPYYPRTRLMGTWPVNRVSPFHTPAWPAPNRPVSVFTKVFENDGVTLSADQHTVWPGQVARFQFNVQYPGNGIAAGNYQEHFDLVQDGAPNWWVPGGYAWQTVTVPEPFQASIRAVSPEATVRPSQNDVLSFDFQNTGAQFWKDDLSALPYYPRTRLMGTWPVNRSSGFAHSSWISPNRPVSVFTQVFENNGVTLSADQHTVWPGQVARFRFTVTHPTNGTPIGRYQENFDLVQDGASNWWVHGGYAWQAVNIAP